MRCVAEMRREPLEIYKWGRILPKPDNRDTYERLEDEDATAIMKECRKAEECSIREYQEYQKKVCDRTCLCLLCCRVCQRAG